MFIYLFFLHFFSILQTAAKNAYITLSCMVQCNQPRMNFFPYEEVVVTGHNSALGGYVHKNATISKQLHLGKKYK